MDLRRKKVVSYMALHVRGLRSFLRRVLKAAAVARVFYCHGFLSGP